MFSQHETDVSNSESAYQYSQTNRELEIFKHLESVTIEHDGRTYVQQLQDNFRIKGRYGEHECFVMTPLGMSLRTFQELLPEGVFEQNLVKSALDQVLIGVDFLHDANVIHTDIHSDNLLIAITDDSILKAVEEDEVRTPSARKQVDDITTYVSRYMLGGAGPLTICDFGQARIGSYHRGNAMPVPYPTPEVILNMEWDQSVDVWSLGLLTWDLLEKDNLFTVYDAKHPELNDAHHLAAITALLGPPPPQLLDKSKEASKYWTIDGSWKGPLPLPNEQNLQALAMAFTGNEKDDFVSFVSRFLRWLPQDRFTPSVAYSHQWLRVRSEKPG